MNVTDHLPLSWFVWSSLPRPQSVIGLAFASLAFRCHTMAFCKWRIQVSVTSADWDDLVQLTNSCSLLPPLYCNATTKWPTLLLVRSGCWRTSSVYLSARWFWWGRGQGGQTGWLPVAWGRRGLFCWFPDAADADNRQVLLYCSYEGMKWNHGLFVRRCKFSLDKNNSFFPPCEVSHQSWSEKNPDETMSKPNQPRPFWETNTTFY